MFTADEGQAVEIEIDVSLASRDKVPVIEIIKNGSLGTITFQRSGWFLIRAITDLLMLALPMITRRGPDPSVPGFRWKPSVHWLCKAR